MPKRMILYICGIFLSLSFIRLEAASLLVSPRHQEIECGKEVKVDVLVKDALDMIGFQLDLVYDPNILTFQQASLSEGVSASQVGPAHNGISSGKKSVRIGGYVFSGVILSDNESHRLLDIGFIATQRGNSNLDFAECIFVGKGIQLMPIQYENGSVRVIVPNQPPVAKISASSTQGEAPLRVKFKGSDSYDPDGDKLSYLWNFGDASSLNKGGTSTSPDPLYTYKIPGTYKAILKVTDPYGASSEASIDIVVRETNTPPVIKYLRNYWNIWIVWQGWDKEDGYRLTYSYRIDNAGWSNWSRTRWVYISSLRLNRGWHTFYVKANDSRGLESEVKSVKFYAGVRTPKKAK